MKKHSYFIITLIVIVIFLSLFFSYTFYKDLFNLKSSYYSTTVKAKVMDLISNTSDSTGNKVKIKIISGKHKGEILIVDNFSSYDYTGKNIKPSGVNKNDKIYVGIQQNKNGKISSAIILDYIRYNKLLIPAAIFILLLLVIGKTKGIASLMSLAIVIFSIIKIIIPYIKSGHNPTLITILVCIFLLIINNLIICGINKKCMSSIIGTSLGILCSAVLMIAIGTSFHIIGISDDDQEALMAIFPNTHIYFKGILYSAILLGSLGALIDTGISISSSMNEIISNDRNISRPKLIKSGMHVGKDIVGAMAGTLILAYTGSSLVLFLIIFSSYHLSFIQIINQDIISSEIFKSLIGSIGLMLSVPFTVISMAYLHFKFKKE